MITQLFKYFEDYKKYAILAPLAIMLETVLEVIIPFLMAKIIDIGVKNMDMAYIAKTGGLMLTLALFALIFGALAGRLSAIGATGFAKNLRHALFKKVQSLSFSNMDKFGTPSLITRLTTDVTNTQGVVMMMLRILIRAPVMFVFATSFAVYINPRLSMVFLIAVPILIIGMSLIMAKAFPRFQIMLKHYDKLNGIVQENLTAIRVVKAYVREGEENEKFKEAAELLRNSQRRAEKLVIISMPLMQLIMYASMVSIVWFGGNMIISEIMKPGELMGFLSYVTQILMSLMMVAMVFINIVISKASVTRMLEVLNEEPDIVESAEIIGDGPAELEITAGQESLAPSEALPVTAAIQASAGPAAQAGPAAPTAPAGAAVSQDFIRFEDLSFSYIKDMENPILSHINLTIGKGETVGIVGGTGSGKSTLVQLIPRLYEATAGSVFIDGKNVKDYPLQELRDKVSMVLQNNVLFSGSIRENLRWGNAQATDQEIIEACKSASAHDFIMAFPDGYDTILGQGGVNLSGGQKQRLTIARALLKKPDVIILDDSTSAVDTNTDSKIRKALKEELIETTTIIIAQRVASVMDADKIIVMEEGKIDGIGTHSELLEANKIYREVYESQKKGVAELE